IKPERLVAKGYGESCPLAPNETPDGSDNPEGRQMNRRTEMKIIGVEQGSYIDDAMLFMFEEEDYLVGKSYILKNIYYDFDKYTIRKESGYALKELQQFLKDNPELIVEIGNHTDDKGSSDYGQSLTQKRAEAVVDYLIEKRIDGKRLKAKGYQATVPVAPNETCTGEDNPEGRMLNRRTEVKVIGFLEQTNKKEKKRINKDLVKGGSEEKKAKKERIKKSDRFICEWVPIIDYTKIEKLGKSEVKDAPVIAPIRPKMELIVYPNPAIGTTNLTVITKEDGNINLSLYDLNGKLVKVIEKAYLEAGNHLYYISKGTMDSNVYLIRLESKDSVITKKVSLL
ncbi:MAG: OmpA family protein, partial [Bacteroidetes bacterium]|nr:OmpA family protein [Bacteroidota bacterium]